jgi:prolipoprotein diacylglyceryltransferase
MSGLALHSLFDIIAWLAAGLAAYWAARRTPAIQPLPQANRLPYLAALVTGAALGAYGFGSLNLYLSDAPGMARSIEGGLFGAILSVEVYKRAAGLKERTGARYALPLAVGVALGRIGCFLSGLDDFTHGVPTDLAIGYDFGDGVKRHPVQLYESASMALFALFYVVELQRKNAYVARNGFYLAVFYYGAQRFGWEFLKPYGRALGPFTLFHLLSIILMIYAAAMLATAKEAIHERPFGA